MFNSYNNPQKVEINAVSGTLVKNYKDSVILKFHSNSKMAEKLFDLNPKVRVNSYTDLPVVVLQVMLSNNNELIAEVIRKEDFDRMYEMQTERKDKG